MTYFEDMKDNAYLSNNMFTWKGVGIWMTWGNRS